MKYIIMCGGTYKNWKVPRQLTPINGEPVIKRTIRLLKDAGVKDIAISSNDDRFGKFGVPILRHDNNFVGYETNGGCWADAFFPTEEPACYLMGDVVFSPHAIDIIVGTETDGIEFFASAPPFHQNYIKSWAEPFAFKVVNQGLFRLAINFIRKNETLFCRKPIAWELWQVIKGTPLNDIITNYTVINDYTCDIDTPRDAELIMEVINNYGQ